jgi:hypothetical protein
MVINSFGAPLTSRTRCIISSSSRCPSPLSNLWITAGFCKQKKVKPLNHRRLLQTKKKSNLWITAGFCKQKKSRNIGAYSGRVYCWHVKPVNRRRLLQKIKYKNRRNIGAYSGRGYCWHVLRWPWRFQGARHQMTCQRYTVPQLCREHVERGVACILYTHYVSSWWSCGTRSIP